MQPLWQCDICRRLGDEARMMVSEDQRDAHWQEHRLARQAYAREIRPAPPRSIEMYRLPAPVGA
jgi:hypothetical protein